MTPKICVVGSSNIDLVTYAPRLPKLGETVTGTSFQTGFGGKGANQAVMAAKLGADVTMITKLGTDSFGRDTLENYEALGFDTSQVLFTDQAATGVAPIWVEESSGNNAIIVAAGANDLLSPQDIANARDAIAAAQILICQWEVPLETTLAALEIARASGVTTIFNPAPARGELPAEAYALSDILSPNESETEMLTGLSVTTVDEAEVAGKELLARGAGKVILTLGERGSLLIEEDGATHVPTTAVKAIDTTGAGDSFMGSLGYFLGTGAPITTALERANQIASVSVQATGTQSSFPDRAALPAELFE